MNFNAEQINQQPQLNKKDLLLSFIIGIVVAAAILVIGANIKINIPYKIALAVALPILSPLGLWILYHLGKRKIFFFQIGKFILVGALNTFIDLGVLNLLIFITNITAGFGFAAFKGTAFVVATINSYFWNKLWTFKSTEGTFREFFVVSVIGFFLNVGTASIVVDVIGPVGQLSGEIWANVGAISATVVSLVWNFLGYKFIVFKR